MKKLINDFVNFSIVIFLFTMFAMPGCKNDPVSPVTEEKEKPLTTKTIGPDGGIVETEDVSITVPAGAFSGSHEIAIYNFTDDQAFGENTGSDFYKINGLPENYSQPIKIKIKYNGEVFGESFIANGKKAINNLSGDSLIIYDLLAASDSSGYLNGYLPVNEPNNTSLNKSTIYGIDLSLYVGPVLYYKISETKNFKIKYPISLESSFSEVAEVLETIYTVTQEELNLALTLNEGNKWNVLIKTQKEVISGELETININRDLVNKHIFNDIKLRLLEYFISSYVFFLHDEVKKTYFYEDNYWLVSAISAWAQKFIPTGSEYKYPEKFLENAMAPFNGINGIHANGGFENKIIAHGIGISSLIQYLVENEGLGKECLSKTYNDFANGLELTDAFLRNKDGLLVDWLPDFFKTYINNEIYDLPKKYFLENAHQEWSINNNYDTLKVFASKDKDIGLYPDLSAKLFRINLNNPEVDTTQNMLLSMKGLVTEFGLSLVVFGIQDSNAIHLGTVHAQDFQIPNLKDYYVNKRMRQFLIVLVNALGESPYLGKSDIDLTVKITNTEQNGGSGDPNILNLTECGLSIQVMGAFETNVSGQIELYSEETVLSSTYITGSFSGNTFTGNYEQFGKIETINVTLNDTYNQITNFNWKMEFENEWGTSSEEVSGNTIPLIADNKNTFELFGSGSCEKISKIIAQGEVTKAGFAPVGYTILRGFSCNAQSYIHIKFR